MTDKIFDLQIRVPEDGNICVMSSAVMQYDGPVQRQWLQQRINELLDEWMGMTFERSCKNCAHAQLLNEGDEPAWDCGLHINLMPDADPEFREFYARCMESGMNEDQTGAYCQRYRELDSLSSGESGDIGVDLHKRMKDAEDALYMNLPDFLKRQAD